MRLEPFVPPPAAADFTTVHHSSWGEYWWYWIWVVVAVNAYKKTVSNKRGNKREKDLPIFMAQETRQHLLGPFCALFGWIVVEVVAVHCGKGGASAAGCYCSACEGY